MTAKLPPPTQEATYFCNKCGYFGQVGPSHANCSYHSAKHGPFWDEGAVLQAVRDALERAEDAVDSLHPKCTPDECSAAIRALLKEYSDDRS